MDGNGSTFTAESSFWHKESLPKAFIFCSKPSSSYSFLIDHAVMAKGHLGVLLHMVLNE